MTQQQPDAGAEEKGTSAREGAPSNGPAKSAAGELAAIHALLQPPPLAPQAPGPSIRNIVLLFSGIVIVLVSALGVALYVALRSPWARGAVATAEGEADLAEHEQAKKRATLAADFARAELNRERFNDLQKGATRALKRLDETLLPLEQKWSTQIAELPTNEAGRDIAAVSALALQFIDIRDNKKPEPPAAAEWRGRLEKLREGALSVMASDVIPTPPAEETLQELQAVGGLIEASIVKHESSAAALDRLRAAAAKDKIPPVSLTLAEVLEQLQESAQEKDASTFAKKLQEQEAAHAREAEARAAALADEIMKVRKEMSEKLAAQELEHERALARLKENAVDAQHREKLALAETERAQREREAQEREAAARNAVLKKKAEGKDIQEALRPFTDADYFQLAGETVTEKSSMSWSAIQKSGALSDNHEGLKILYTIVFHEQNKRSKGSWGTIAGENAFYTVNDYPDRRAFIARVQGYLKELGPVLVETKKLRP